MKQLMTLVGFSFASLRGGPTVLKRDMSILLVREPDNPHDPNAVRAYIDIGYIKRGDAKGLAADMDSKGLTQWEGRLVNVYSAYGAVEVEEPNGTNASAFDLLLDACKNFVKDFDDTGNVRITDLYNEMSHAIAIAERK